MLFMLIFHTHNIHTIQRLQYPGGGGALQFFAYTHGAIWTIQHWTGTFTLKIIDHMIYMTQQNFQNAEGESKPSRSEDNFWT